jgi:transcriptional regulator with XRE-family HTH domain
MPLGTKIRDLRLRRGLTVQQLAEASGLSKGFISQIENHRTSPSLATLHDLARALETSAAYLVVEEEQEPHVVRAAERPRVPVGGNTSRVEILSARPKRNLELVQLDLPAGVDAGEQRHYHHGEACLLCVEGQVRLTCNDRTIELETGDSCHYDGRLPHAIENGGRVNARVLLAMTPAAFEPMFQVRHANGAAAKPPVATTARMLEDALT